MRGYHPEVARRAQHEEALPAGFLFSLSVSSSRPRRGRALVTSVRLPYASYEKARPLVDASYLAGFFFGETAAARSLSSWMSLGDATAAAIFSDDWLLVTGLPANGTPCSPMLRSFCSSRTVPPVRTTDLRIMCTTHIEISHLLEGTRVPIVFYGIVTAA
jgi:hypothetical protein